MLPTFFCTYMVLSLLPFPSPPFFVHGKPPTLVNSFGGAPLWRTAGHIFWVLVCFPPSLACLWLFFLAAKSGAKSCPKLGVFWLFVSVACLVCAFWVWSPVAESARGMEWPSMRAGGDAAIWLAVCARRPPFVRDGPLGVCDRRCYERPPLWACGT